MLQSYPNSVRCIAFGMFLLALGLGLRWLSVAIWANPEGTQAALELIYSERGALLQCVQVTAFAVITAGMIGTSDPAAALNCALWMLTGGMLEAAQHPAVAGPILHWLQREPLPNALADLVAMPILNGRFAISEILATLVGGVLAYSLIRRIRSASRLRPGEHR